MHPDEIIVDGKPIDFGYYPDGMPWVKTRTFSTMVLRPKSLEAFSIAMLFIDSMNLRGDKILDKKILFPYFIGSRQDRLSESGDSLFTARSIAWELNSRFIPITTYDPHSDVICAMLNFSEIISAAKIISMYRKNFENSGYSGIISPDAGSVKRCHEVAKVLGIKQVLNAWKKRDIETGELSGFGMEKPPQESIKGHYLVVDDICDGGGTFIGLGEILKENQITADLYVTHGIFSNGTEGLLKRYKKIYCTDSIIGEKKGVNVLKIVREFMLSKEKKK